MTDRLTSHAAQTDSGIVITHHCGYATPPLPGPLTVPGNHFDGGTRAFVVIDALGNRVQHNCPEIDTETGSGR